MFLLSFFLVMKVLGVAEPKEVEPRPTILLKILFSVLAVDTFTYHWELAVSY